MGAPPLERVTVAVDADGGSWRFVIGDQFVVALPSDADPAVSTALQELEHSRPSIETLVALLPIGGERALESFAVLVSAPASDTDGVPLSGVVRGGIAVDVYSVGGSRRFTDRGIRPWLLADFRSVTAVVVQTDGAPVPRPDEIAVGAPTAPGVASGSRLDWLPGPSAERSRSAVPATDAAPPAATPVPAAAAAPAPVPVPVPDQAFRPRAEPEAASLEDTIIRPRRFDADTVIRPRRFDADTVILRRSPGTTAPPPRTPPAPKPAATPTPPPVIESLRVEPVIAPAPPVEAPREPPARERSTTSSAPAAPVAPAAPDLPTPTSAAPAPASAADRPAYAFSIGRGAAVALDAVYLIGRKPRLGRVPVAGEDVRLLAVPSPTLEVSSTHVEIRTRGEAVVVTDLRSTNGTVVVPPRAGRIRLRPGESLVVTPGTAVHIGDDTIISISAAEPSPERSPLPPRREGR